MQSTILSEILSIVVLIPKGKVATYGQIAKLAGMPKHARYVGYALKNLENNSDVPWHRVINSKGMLSLEKDDEKGMSIQQQLLLAENIVVLGGKINLKEFQWKP
jgi:methylated-DNA-protein-cysteine methyltransferase related protein